MSRSEFDVDSLRADVKRTIVKFYKDLGYVAPELYAEKFNELIANVDGQIVNGFKAVKGEGAVRLTEKLED